MNNKLKVFSYSLLLLSLGLFTYVNIERTIDISYPFSVFYFLILTLFTFAYGLIMNVKKSYKVNINIYLVLYIVLLINLTLFIGRVRTTLIYSTYLKQYIASINFIPFKTISSYLFGISDIKYKAYNILGNLVALVPLSFLLLLKDDKYKKVKKQFIYLSVTVILIEVLQFITTTGRLDIDDFILNIGGALLFLVIINKIRVFDKVKNLFYNDFNMNIKIKKIVYIFFTIIIIVLNSLLIIKMLKPRIIDNEPYKAFYIKTKDDCVNSILETVDMGSYSIHYVCVIATYATMQNEQMSIDFAIENDYIKKSYFEENFDFVETYEYSILYKNYDMDISVLQCNTTDDNKDLYIGNSYMNYEKKYCK